MNISYLDDDMGVNIIHFDGIFPYDHPVFFWGGTLHIWNDSPTAIPRRPSAIDSSAGVLLPSALRDFLGAHGLSLRRGRNQLVVWEDNKMEDRLRIPSIRTMIG